MRGSSSTPRRSISAASPRRRLGSRLRPVAYDGAYRRGVHHRPASRAREPAQQAALLPEARRPRAHARLRSRDGAAPARARRPLGCRRRREAQRRAALRSRASFATVRRYPALVADFTHMRVLLPAAPSARAASRGGDAMRIAMVVHSYYPSDPRIRKEARPSPRTATKSVSSASVATARAARSAWRVWRCGGSASPVIAPRGSSVTSRSTPRSSPWRGHGWRDATRRAASMSCTSRTFRTSSSSAPRSRALGGRGSCSTSTTRCRSSSSTSTA